MRGEERREGRREVGEGLYNHRLLEGFTPLQRHRYHSKDITVANFEKGSLFLQVPRADAEKSIWSAFKYFVNHFFELYGLEVIFRVTFFPVLLPSGLYREVV